MNVKLRSKRRKRNVKKKKGNDVVREVLSTMKLKKKTRSWKKRMTKMKM